MKLKHLLYAAVAGLFTFASCGELSEELGAPSIKVTPGELSFEVEEDSKTVTLEATLNWSVTTDLSSSWVALSQEKGEASNAKQTITVSVEKNDGEYDRSQDIVFSIGLAKATLTVYQKGTKGAYEAEEGDGSAEKPYNVAQAVALVQNLTWTSSSDYQKTDKVYVKGKIASIKYPYDFANGTATFDITDDGTAVGSKLTAYSLFYLGGNKWLEGNSQIAVNDIVVIYGELMNYQNNTPETVKATSYLYSLNGVTEDNNGKLPDFDNAEEKSIAEFISAASTSTYYKVTGTVYGNINTQYGNFNIKDDTGSIQIYGAVNWNEWKDKVKANSKVTVAGTYKKYNETDEIVNGYILSCEDGEPEDYNAAPEKTVAEFIAAADKANYYKLTGKVSKFNSQYCSFDLTDASGTIYVYSVANKADWSDKISNGGTVVLAGMYDFYSSKNQHEVVNAQILSFEPGEAIDYSAVPEKTVADFITAADTQNYYKLTGKVSKFNSQYCSFDLTDASGTIYVYSVANKADWSDKISDGGTVVLAGLYEYYSSKQQHEVVNAQILSFEPGEAVDYSAAPEKTVADFITAADTQNYYKLTGKVSKFNSQYCSFDLTDASGTIYVYSVANKADWSDKISDGGTVVLAGLYEYYSSKQQHEVVKAQILSFEPGEAVVDPVDYSAAPEKTVADFITAADTQNYYKLTGKVSKFNSQYCSFDLTDASGTIYVYSVANKADWSDKISDGGTVVLAGLYEYYSSKQQHEVVKAQILSFEPGEAPTPSELEEVKAVTIAEFIAAPESGTQPYKLNGKVSNLVNSTYGNFDLIDDTGTVYVYGLTATNLGYGATNDKSFSSLNLYEGDIITIIGFRGSYNDKVEVMNAYFVEKTGQAEQEQPEPGTSVIEFLVSDYAAANNWENSKQYKVMDKSGVTLTATGGGNTGKFYSSGNDWRFYQNENAALNISVSDDLEFVSVTFNYTVTNSGMLVDSTGAEVKPGEKSSSKSFSVANSGTATNGQVRFTKIAVTVK